MQLSPNYCCSEINQEQCLLEVEGKLSDLEHTKWQAVARELQGEDTFQYLRAYSPGTTIFQCCNVSTFSHTMFHIIWNFGCIFWARNSCKVNGIWLYSEKGVWARCLKLLEILEISCNFVDVLEKLIIAVCTIRHTLLCLCSYPDFLYLFGWYVVIEIRTLLSVFSTALISLYVLLNAVHHFYRMMLC